MKRITIVQRHFLFCEAKSMTKFKRFINFFFAFVLKRYDKIQQKYRKVVCNVLDTNTNLDKKLRTDFSLFFCY